jgi:hypothetical protein
MTDTGPDPDSTDPLAAEPDEDASTGARDPFEEAVVDEEEIEEVEDQADDDAGDE